MITLQLTQDQAMALLQLFNGRVQGMMLPRDSSVALDPVHTQLLGLIADARPVVAAAAPHTLRAPTEPVRFIEERTPEPRAPIVTHKGRAR